MLTDLLSRAGLRSRRQTLKVALWLLRKVYEAESGHSDRISDKLGHFDDEDAEYDYSVVKAMEEDLEISEYALDCLMSILDELEMVY